MLLRIPFGDLVLVAGAEIPGLQRLNLVWRIGPEQDTTPADRVVKGSRARYITPPRKVDLIMDLKADKKRTVSVPTTDEVGNPVPLPEGASVVYSVDDPALINLTDNGDGSAVVAAVGVLGETVLRVTGTLNGLASTKEALISVIAGDAERFGEFVFGDEEEVTPDTPPV